MPSVPLFLPLWWYVTCDLIISLHFGILSPLPLSEKGIYSDLEVGDNYPFRDDFDAVIRCLGFKFDDSIFSRSPAASAHATKSSGSSHPGSMSGKKKKYPNVTPDYQAANVSGLYFIGVIGHGVDWRESAGENCLSVIDAL